MANGKQTEEHLMTENLPSAGDIKPKSFEQLKIVNPHGAEYWSARDLQVLLGYSQWRGGSKKLSPAP